MKIKALEKFFDLELKVLHEAGEVFEVSEDRGAALTSKNNKTKRILCAAVMEVEAEEAAASEEEPGEEKAEIKKEKPKRKKAVKNEKAE